jgi:hypothetical protein
MGWDPEACYADRRVTHGVIPALRRLTERAATLVESPFAQSHLHQLYVGLLLEGCAHS